eukprot:scaffold36894_cov128-Skeletonema_dohrnii-CCMP3373.AAC.1
MVLVVVKYRRQKLWQSGLSDAMAWSMEDAPMMTIPSKSYEEVPPSSTCQNLNFERAQRHRPLIH